MQPVFKLIVALSTYDRGIGTNNTIPWKLREDLKHFKEKTIHHTLVMGRKTFESLGSKPLPEREFVVLSRSPRPEGLNPAVIWCNTVEQVHAAVVHEETVWVIGGAEIYKEFLPLCEELWMTWVTAEHPEMDTFFPPWNTDDYTQESNVVLTTEPIHSEVACYQKKKSEA